MEPAENERTAPVGTPAGAGAPPEAVRTGRDHPPLVDLRALAFSPTEHRPSCQGRRPGGRRPAAWRAMPAFCGPVASRLAPHHHDADGRPGEPGRPTTPCGVRERRLGTVAPETSNRAFPRRRTGERPARPCHLPPARRRTAAPASGDVVAVTLFPCTDPADGSSTASVLRGPPGRSPNDPTVADPVPVAVALPGTQHILAAASSQVKGYFSIHRVVHGTFRLPTRFDRSSTVHTQPCAQRHTVRAAFRARRERRGVDNGGGQPVEWRRDLDDRSRLRAVARRDHHHYLVRAGSILYARRSRPRGRLLDFSGRTT